MKQTSFTDGVHAGKLKSLLAPLKLPVVLSPEVWQEAVDIQTSFNPNELALRYSELLIATYGQALTHPTKADIDFGIFQFPPSGDRSRRVWIALRLRRLQGEHPFLHVALRGEDPARWLTLTINNAWF